MATENTMMSSVEPAANGLSSKKASEFQAQMTERFTEISKLTLMLRDAENRLTEIATSREQENQVFLEQIDMLTSSLDEANARVEKAAADVHLREKSLERAEAAVNVKTILLNNRVITRVRNYRVNNARKWLSIRRASSPLAEQVSALKTSALFDADWYVDQYLDVKEAGTDPCEHYCLYGWQEFRNPSAHFDTLFYLNDNRDVLEVGINPLLHYVLWGHSEDRPVRSVLA